MVCRLHRLAPLLAVVFALSASAASAQVSIAGYTLNADRQERVGENHWILTGRVELEGENTKLYADEVEYFADQNRAICRGNVTLIQGENRISADRAEFNTQTRLGTFYNATGSSRVRPPRPSPGAFAAPQLSGSQENDVYFFGEVVEKSGPKKYRISNGGFTTCVQPTPRWNLTADTVILNVDDYTLLRDAILKVKGVPLLYLPIMYYPTTEDDRATGFLIPTYGNSTLRGQMISNAFFWAIGRSHDVTVEHDWFSRGAQAFGSEYRYNMGSGDGSLRGYFLNQQQTSYLLDNGGTQFLPGKRSYQFRGTLSQRLPGNFRARASVDYFSDLQTQQTFNTNVWDITQNQRNIGANVVGSFAGYSLNGTFDRRETFYSTTDSSLTGSTPRINLSRGERPLFGNSPVYFSAVGEFAHLEKAQRTAARTSDQGLVRTDFSPQIRYPFRRWQWFTVNSSLGWRNTFWSRSLATPRNINTVVPEFTNETTADNIVRSLFTMQAQVVGPVFTRIFNTPGNTYAERFKHSIEPFVNVQRTTGFEEFNRVVIIDGVDTIIGNTTNFTYGLWNRLYARRKAGQLAQAQEIVTLEISQSYYTNAQASRYDPSYATNTTTAAPSNFSPIKLNVRAAPSAAINAAVTAEVDREYLEFRTLTFTGGYNWTSRVQTNMSWSQRFLIPGLPGFDDPVGETRFLTFTTNARTVDNRYGSAYSLSYDIIKDSLLQQRLTAFYNAQCCGIAFEYQKASTAAFYGLPSDRRFFLSFTLAGLGNFSPFNGAMNGVPR
jgi:LPS-assembly protein